MSAFVAQNMGAGKAARARAALGYGIATALGVAVVIASFAFFRRDLLAGIFSRDPGVIAQAHDYLIAYAIDTLLTSVLFCCVGYFNGCGHTLFVMAQGILGAVLVRIPVVYLVSLRPNPTLFQIGLATPCATLVQLTLCLIFLALHRRRGTPREIPG